MEITLEKVKVAYRKLKTYVYYDKTDLSLRFRLADFEIEEGFESRLVELYNQLGQPGFTGSEYFRNLLACIGYRVVPKKIYLGDEQCHSDSGKYITNVTSSREYNVEGVNYFIDAPIEIHLISVLWLMFEGRFLDQALGDECYGGRLEDSLKYDNDESANLFVKYHEQYAKWRDTGIKKARDLLVEDRKNVAVLGLDIKQFFYYISPDYNLIKKIIGIHFGAFPFNDPHESILLDSLEKVSEKYYEEISACFNATHPELAGRVVGLPIGLCSSVVIANWCLKEFDNAVMKNVRPAYYGRYVDDILLAVTVPDDLAIGTDDPVGSFIKTVLVGANILKEKGKDGRYEVNGPTGIYLQADKCILQYFDASHSIAGLEKFKKKLEENASDFRLLPVEEADNSLEDVAYELMYEGSVNKFSSVKGMAENRYELAKHLAKQSIWVLVTEDGQHKAAATDLKKFFKGKNAIEFYDLWERVFTFLVIAKNKRGLDDFNKQLTREISRVSHKSAFVQVELQKSLKQHLWLSLLIALALLGSDQCDEDVLMWIANIRKSNLIRHHFVRHTLLNYTDYMGSLVDRKLHSPILIDEQKFLHSPRYINFDECMLLCSNADSGDGEINFSRAYHFYKLANRKDFSGVNWENAGVKS